MHDSITVSARPARVIRATPDSEKWDSVVHALDGGTFCHLFRWCEVMSDVLGHECTYLAAENEEGSWEGVLPLVHVKSRIVGRFLISMPFLNDGGPLGSEPVRLQLTNRALEEAQRSDVDLLELRTRHPVAGSLSVSERKISVHLPLPETPELLWEKTFRSKLRSQIRRPQKEGMETRFGLEQVEPFYEVFSRNMRDLGTPVLPRDFFLKIAKTFPDQVVFGAVYSGNIPVAGGCGFQWKEEFEITWASSLREYNHLAPNMLLYWAFMQQVIARGAGVFNFGRCTPGGTTHRFKLQWGGHDVALPWAQWPPQQGAGLPSTDRALFRVATALWRRAPLAITNRFGPTLARRLP